MKNELRTMAEKKQQDPKEMMENGLTREQNEKLQENHSTFQVFISLIVICLSAYSIWMVFSI